MRSEAETDRDAMERGARAFVSFVRGYKEHQLKYVFRLQVRPLPFFFCTFRIVEVGEGEGRFRQLCARLQGAPAEIRPPPAGAHGSAFCISYLTYVG